MPDVRQRVVLRDEGDGRTRAAELRNKRGFDAVGTNLDIEAGARRSISEPSAGLMLLESELGGVMNAMAQVNQERGEGIDRRHRIGLQSCGFFDLDRASHAYGDPSPRNPVISAAVWSSRSKCGR
jgi:hypothetical protein